MLYYNKQYVLQLNQPFPLDKCAGQRACPARVIICLGQRLCQFCQATQNKSRTGNNKCDTDVLTRER